VRTWRSSSSAQRDDVLYLGQRQPEPATLLDEREDTQGVRRIDAVAGGGTTRGRQNAASFVEPERLAACATPGCYLANEEPVLHVGQDRACPKGQGQECSGVRGEANPAPPWPLPGRTVSQYPLHGSERHLVGEAPSFHRPLRPASLWKEPTWLAVRG
jgi:hypothetical protein